ncbi:MAG TPA: dehydrogenase E1 component subunit alpha/beta [Candidatus Saccharimonadales bacterium]|nr:dehydrogenase E1 component subunit alpha/beta [Candidatus Saccharimonadales bacterium]
MEQQQKVAGKPSLDPGILLELYRKMLRVYYVEEAVRRFVRQNKCSFHASTRGHEKLQIAVSMLLKPGKDWFFPYYREKALMVGLGMPLKEIFLHMLSRRGDPCGEGRNMSEHFSSRDLHVVSPTACTGSQYLPAVGMAKAIQYDGGDEIVYVSSGEGATSEGEFFEALNQAQRERLPVLFVVQNNGYAISVPQAQQTSSEIHQIARGFGMDAFRVDGTRFTQMYQAIKPKISRIRRGSGPVLIEAMVVRLDSHSSSDDQTKYRTEEQMAVVRRHDPILHTELRLREMKLLTDEQVKEMRSEAEREVSKAAAEADAAPPPEEERVTIHIYSQVQPAISDAPPSPASDQPVTMVDAINHGLREEMDRNEKIVIWGEDVQDPKGGVFGVTRGLTEKFGERRIFNSPLAEASIVGVAQGMAVGGYKPVVEIQFGDYSWPGFMQMRNEISTLRWRSGGVWSCPMVVRIAVGGYIRGGPFHSQCIEALYAHTPGWLIAFPSSAADAKGLIKTACRLDDPVLFLEHKGLYRQVYSKSEEPGPGYLIPFGSARRVREGTDLTVVSWGRAVHMVSQALTKLGDEAPSVDLIDLRTIVPLDMEKVLESVKRTGKALVVHEDSVFMGFGAELAARIAGEAFEYLDAPVRRAGALNSFVPFAPNLESTVLPSVEGICREITEMKAY